MSVITDQSHELADDFVVDLAPDAARPSGAFQRTGFHGGIFSLYFILMIVAMYPGAAADSLDPA